MPSTTLPEVPAELLDQVLAGWSLHLAANGGSLDQAKAAELAIAEALAYARHNRLMNEFLIVERRRQESGEAPR